MDEPSHLLMFYLIYKNHVKYAFFNKKFDFISKILYNIASVSVYTLKFKLFSYM